MPSLTESVHVEASMAETWGHFFAAPEWGSWVDGFEAVVEAEGYPETGGTLRWCSIPAGRGEVLERVLAHEHRQLHRIAFEDPAMLGEQETRFAIDGDGTRVETALSYRLAGMGPLTRFAGLFFVRSQVRASVQRTLLGFKHSCEEAAAE